MLEPNYIAIEGVIGVGKSTFARMLADRIGAELIMDEAMDNPFLVDFYKNLTLGLPKDRSLRLAKLNYLKSTEDPLRAHPHFWLSFIVTGDTAPVKFSEKFNWGMGFSLFVGFIIVGFILWSKRNGYHWKKIEFSRLFHFL